MINDWLDSGLGGLAFTTVAGTFDSILTLAMPIDRSAVVQVQNAGARSPRSDIGHEVSIDKRSKECRLSLRGRCIMRDGLRAIAALRPPIAVDNLEARAVGKIDVELDSRVLATPKVGIDALRREQHRGGFGFFV